MERKLFGEFPPETLLYFLKGFFHTKPLWDQQKLTVAAENREVEIPSVSPGTGDRSDGRCVFVNIGRIVVAAPLANSRLVSVLLGVNCGVSLGGKRISELGNERAGESQELCSFAYERLFRDRSLFFGRIRPRCGEALFG